MNSFFSRLFLLSVSFGIGSGVFASDLIVDFRRPSMKYRPQPLYFWNDSVVADTVAKQMTSFCFHDGYGGFAVVGYGSRLKPEYLSDAYFKLYGKTLAKARELGLSMSLYDEFGFPSGSAGATNADTIPRFKQRYPQMTLKRLEKIEESVTGPGVLYRRIPEGTIMAVVGMDTVTHVRYDLASNVYANRLKWHMPSGHFKLFFFYLVPDEEPIVDYLDPAAVNCFIDMTHQAYYNRFKGYFGSVIKRSFFDEPTLYRAKGRMWTPAFNDKFIRRYGFNPATLYPALWYDIGPETQAARNYLFGFRSELYATGYTKGVNDWSVAHGIRATGHQDQEEVVNPVGVSGDLMKCFKYLSIPGIDKIGGNRPAEKFYKLISSAAYNWDKPYVMAETFGAMGNLSIDSMYAIAMDQYAKGINLLMPHAVWYNDRHVTFRPELSYRNPLYQKELYAFNMYLSRLNVMLQAPARHVADIAILYPIQTLQGEHYLDGPLKPVYGGVAIPRTDYIDVSTSLTDSLGIDFTFLHPEVLDSSGIVKDSLLTLKNKMNPEVFRVLILPSVKTISLSNIKKIKAFYDKGGKLLFTTRLPYKSAEFGKDDSINLIVRSIFPDLPVVQTGDSFPEQSMEAFNQAGGKAAYVPRPIPLALRTALTTLLLDRDVLFEAGKPLTYLHKIREKQDVFFFANPGKSIYSGNLKLRGRFFIKLLNPHTGDIIKTVSNFVAENGIDYTLFHLDLEANRSMILLGNRMIEPPVKRVTTVSGFSTK